MSSRTHTKYFLSVTLASIFLAFFGHSSEEPETRIRLVLPKIKRKGLPSDYGKKAAQLLFSKRNEMSQCFESTNEKTTLALNINISVSGRAKILQESDKKEVSVCLQSVLATILFPTHPLKDGVEISFPITVNPKSNNQDEAQNESSE